MAASRLGISCALAWASPSHVGKATAAWLPAALRTTVAPVLGRFLFWPWGLSLLGKAGAFRLLSLTSPPSAVRVRARSRLSWMAAIVPAACSAASLCHR